MTIALVAEAGVGNRAVTTREQQPGGSFLYPTGAAPLGKTPRWAGPSASLWVFLAPWPSAKR